MLSLILFTRAGWNIISVACLVTDNQKNTLFPASISSAFSFENGYQSNSAMNHGVGCWLKFPPDSSQRSVSIGGYGIELDTVNVISGWNMIGLVVSPTAATSVRSVVQQCNHHILNFITGIERLIHCRRVVDIG